MQWLVTIGKGYRSRPVQVDHIGEIHPLGFLCNCRHRVQAGGLTFSHSTNVPKRVFRVDNGAGVGQQRNVSEATGGGGFSQVGERFPMFVTRIVGCRPPIDPPRRYMQVGYVNDLRSVGSCQIGAHLTNEPIFDQQINDLIMIGGGGIDHMGRADQEMHRHKKGSINVMFKGAWRVFKVQCLKFNVKLLHLPS